MNVEGLWCFQTGDINDPGNLVNGGVVVLETNRLLGGDSAIAYVGDYDAQGGSLTGTVRTFQYNHLVEVYDVFGNKAEADSTVEFRLVPHSDGVFTGALWQQGDPDKALPIVLRFIHALPG